MLNHKTRNDRGAILILALVVVVILGLVVVGIATYTSTALTSSNVTTQIVDRLASAESGAQYGLARADGGSCPATFSDGTINGAAVTTTCQKVARVENADGLFALVVTALGVDSTSHDALILTGTASEANGLKRISGPIYLGEQMTANLTAAAAVALDGATEVGGDVRFDVAGNCLPSSVSPVLATEWAAPQPVVSCDSRGWQAVASTPDLTTDPLLLHTDLQRATVFPGPAYGDVSLPVPTPDVVTGCTQFEPGWFDGSLLPSSTLDLSDPTFFKSGVYYFENVVIDISGHVAVGKRTDLATPTSPINPNDFANECSTEWGNESNATGAVWILGGSSRIKANGMQAQIDFYPRSVERSNAAFGPVDTALISFEAGATVTGGYATTSLNANAADNQNDEKLITRANGSKTDVSFYGLIYAPGSWIDMGQAANDVSVEFVGGLVLARVDIRVAANVPGFTISVATELVDYYLIESTASLNGLSTKVRTVSRETSAPGLEVITWRAV